MNDNDNTPPTAEELAALVEEAEHGYDLSRITKVGSVSFDYTLDTDRFAELFKEAKTSGKLYVLTTDKERPVMVGDVVGIQEVMLGEPVKSVTLDAEVVQERTSVDEALEAWEKHGPTSLTTALMADALYGVRERAEEEEE